ncbi:type II toxin-antitoxin system HicA family toxin [Pseudonocardia aurantiaca]|uniref:Type II toxin-antitoxin system HicA family toxin n=1 Tax=Pseudonocardia aurantiaca TaxID=75290 RepID=A0ABW4FCH8_9PSEU
MVKAMKLREVEEALLAQDCTVLSERGSHTKRGCPCGAHTVPVPRHTIVSPGVVRSIGKRLACLPEGWLQ